MSLLMLIFIVLCYYRIEEIVPKISVIVPIYNVEKYLHRCVDSILAQTFTDFELILVDDGSTDSSGMICDKYAEEDSAMIKWVGAETVNNYFILTKYGRIE